jgi:hypothetical protein
MNDRHVRDKLSEYVDGMLSQEEASAVKEHLDHCPDCMEEYAEMVKIIGHMSQMERLETPEFFMEKVHERLEKPSLLKKIAKGLFFPVKIKLPLEIAGLAAAALLVVYITQIRGKQYVYELTFNQSKSSGVLEEQIVVGQKPKTDREPRVDETAPLNENALPALKTIDKKLDKREKGVGTEEATPQSLMEQSPSAPQENKMKRSETTAGPEGAMPQSKTVQERGEPDLIHQEEKVARETQIEAETPSVAKAQKKEESGLEITDKEIEKIKMEIPKKAKNREEYLREIITGLGGKILESEYNENTQVIEALIVAMPAEMVQLLIVTLEAQGEIQKPYPIITEKDQEIVKIRIRLQQ